jgi:hypothetical protein
MMDGKGTIIVFGRALQGGKRGWGDKMGDSESPRDPYNGSSDGDGPRFYLFKIKSLRVQTSVIISMCIFDVLQSCSLELGSRLCGT